MYLIRWAIALACIALISCTREPEKKTVYRFADLYQHLQEVAPKDQKQTEKLKISIAMANASLMDAVRRLSDISGVSVIFSSSLDDKKISLEVKEQEIDSILSGIARRVGANLTRIGGVYYIGDPKPEDRAVFCAKIIRLSPMQIDSMLKTLLSDNGKSSVSDDGLAVVADKVEVIQRVVELAEMIRSAPSTSYVVQLYFILMSDSLKQELGISGVPTASISRTYAVANGNPTNVFKAAAGFDGLLQVAHNSNASNVLAEPVFLLADQSRATWLQGSEIPIPRKTVTDQGTVSVTGYDITRTGLDVAVDVRQVEARTVRLGLSVSLSNITGYVEAAPILEKDELKLNCSLADGGVYLVGSLKTKRKSNTQNFLNFGRESATLDCQVWARVTLIAGPAAVSPE